MDGTRFVNNVFPYAFPSGAFYGSKATFFQDISGDGNDDLIMVNNNGVRDSTNLSQYGFLPVATSTGLFSPSELCGASFDNTPNYMSDVNGDGKSDFIIGTSNARLSAFREAAIVLHLQEWVIFQ